MKKVILSAVLLMIGSMAIAQVSGDPFAPGITDAATLSPDPAANAVEATQAGIANYMLVRQEGTSSSVFIQQAEGGDALGNLIYVRQSGDVNTNTAASGEDNRVDVDQAGILNESYVRQAGDRNDAAMVQESGGVGNIGYIRQGTGNQAEDNYAGMVQDGEDNSAWIRQSRDNNEALTLQTGDDHQALTIQISDPNQSPGHNARVEQLGEGQMSYVYQIGNNSDADVLQSGAMNYSDVQQSGTGVNTADVDQDGELNKSFIVSAGSNQNATVNQLGDENQSDIMQTGTGQNDAIVVQVGDGNYANQRQTNTVVGGDPNRALINQGDLANIATLSELDLLITDTNDVLNTVFGSPNPGSFNGVAYQTQDGEGNKAEAHQFGDDEFVLIFLPVGVAPNHSKQIQTGNDNEALVVQNAFASIGPLPPGFTPDGANSALQVQTGDNNRVGLIQRDLGNDAWQIQDGEDSALGVQIGVNNNLVSKQYEGANYMETGQAGAGMNIYALQRGGQSFIGNQFGLLNTMEVLQVGPMGDILETIDCDIPDPMDPMPLPPMQDLTIPDINVPGLCTDC